MRGEFGSSPRALIHYAGRGQRSDFSPTGFGEWELLVPCREANWVADVQPRPDLGWSPKPCLGGCRKLHTGEMFQDPTGWARLMVTEADMKNRFRFLAKEPDFQGVGTMLSLKASKERKLEQDPKQRGEGEQGKL